jgi:hypothetical protein
MKNYVLESHQLDDNYSIRTKVLGVYDDKALAYQWYDILSKDSWMDEVAIVEMEVNSAPIETNYIHIVFYPSSNDLNYHLGAAPLKESFDYYMNEYTFSVPFNMALVSNEAALLQLARSKYAEYRMKEE